MLDYYDHNGNRTADPRCELGLCFQCIDSDLAIGQTPVVPALSTHDPLYATDGAYRLRVGRALALAGVTLRDDDEACPYHLDAFGTVGE